MDNAHIHLIIIHLPVAGILLGILLLLYNRWSQQAGIRDAAYLIFIVCAIGAGIAYATGEGAEERIEGLPGVSESLIEAHEETALWALIAMIILGIAALVALAVKQRSASFRIGPVITILAIISFLLIGRTGYLGGQIRHTEIRPDAGLTAPDVGGETQEKGNDDDD